MTHSKWDTHAATWLHLVSPVFGKRHARLLLSMSYSYIQKCAVQHEWVWGGRLEEIINTADAVSTSSYPHMYIAHDAPTFPFYCSLSNATELYPSTLPSPPSFRQAWFLSLTVLILSLLKFLSPPHSLIQRIVSMRCNNVAVADIRRVPQLLECDLHRAGRTAVLCMYGMVHTV